MLGKTVIYRNSQCLSKPPKERIRTRLSQRLY